MSKHFEAMKAGKLAIWPWLPIYREYAHGQAVVFLQKCQPMKEQLGNVDCLALLFNWLKCMHNN